MENGPNWFQREWSRLSEAATDEIRRWVLRVLAAFVLALLATKLWPARLNIYEVTAWFLVLPWVLFALSATWLVVLWKRERRTRQKSVATAAALHARPAKADRFVPIQVIDRKCSLLWHIIRDPEQWIDRPEGGYLGADKIIDGPFHFAEDCHAALLLQGHQSGYINPRCPKCNRNLFPGTLQSFAGRQSVVRELQRIHRLGHPVSGPSLEMDHADYWHAAKRNM